MSTSSLIQVIEKNTKEVLFECELTESESAFEFAANMEKMGLEVQVISPTITETLCDSLGIERDEREEYEQSVIAEIEDHDGSCCATPAETQDAEVIDKDKLQ